MSTDEKDEAFILSTNDPATIIRQALDSKAARDTAMTSLASTLLWLGAKGWPAFYAVLKTAFQPTDHECFVVYIFEVEDIPEDQRLDALNWILSCADQDAMRQIVVVIDGYPQFSLKIERNPGWI